MSKRVITRKERLQRAEKRKKMLQSFELCLFLSIIIVVIYLIIYIPMALNYKNIFLNPLGEFFYSNNDFLLFIRNLYLMKAGIITLADISTAFMLSLFFAFMFIGFANLAEYYKRTAGLLEVIIFMYCNNLIIYYLCLYFGFRCNNCIYCLGVYINSFICICDSIIKNKPKSFSYLII